MDLEFADIEVISAVLGWASSGFKQIEAMRPGDFEAVAEFIGSPINLEGRSDEEIREGLRVMRRDIDRVKQKIKNKYGV